ncbi:MAG: lipocalin family protein [Rhodocyclaceae bacterium]|nr:lipocalin family protein [Rhodocyclaceae bacterium]
MHTVWRPLLLLSLAFAASLATVSQAETADRLPTVQNVDLQRYSGRWYEISRLPMWFERKCLDNITATYTVRSDNRIDVVNSCRTEDGQIKARGIAEIPDRQHPGQLRVRFAPDWMAWLPVVWGDYWIIDLDPEYRWVMVGAPSRGYLWILARTPALDEAKITQLKSKATGLGFDVTPMINVTNSAE